MNESVDWTTCWELESDIEAPKTGVKPFFEIHSGKSCLFNPKQDHLSAS